MRVRRYQDATAFLERARDWLYASEAENSLLLGLLAEILAGPHRFDEPLYFATVEHTGAVIGCAFRTPPYKLGLTRMPVEALPAVAEDVVTVYKELPAVMGPEPLAVAFGELWSTRAGCPARPGMRYRLHALERFQAPDRPAPGRLRPAKDSEMGLLTHWGAGFNDDTRIHDTDPAELIRWLVDQRALYVWDDGGPRSMVTALGGSDRGIRIAYVYTPPEARARGYATTAVAELGRRMLADGYRYCCLYTDLANSTSNAIYANIGYRPVSDVLDVRFD